MRKKNEETALAVKPTTALAGSWEEEMAAEAKAAAATVVATSQRISFKGGNISLGDAKLENPLPIIVADFGFENAYYTEAYDPDAPASPVCFAFGRDEKTMAPHPDSTEKQAEKCHGCPHNEFGSSGKGKACKNGVRLAIISGGVTGDGVATTEVLNAALPPTNLGAWGNYVKGLRDMGLPPWGAITELKNEIFKTWFKVSFRPVGRVTHEVYAAIKARRASIEEQMFAPYKAREEAEEKKPAKKRKF
jgi:hypothetical protein